MKIKFWGTRGSLPVPGEDTIQFGGNTPCLEIIDDNENKIIIDAGTGIRTLGRIIANNHSTKNIDILLTHTHWDHIQGLPFFAPFFSNKFKINIHTNINGGSTLEQILDSQMQPPFFPVKKDVFSADINFLRIDKDCILNFGDIRINAIETHHSQGTLSYKIQSANKTIVYMTDNEIYYRDSDANPDFKSIKERNSDLIEFAYNADYLIHDSMYKLQDFPNKLGWGHSNNIAAAHLAILADVKNLILFHYEPTYSDKDIIELVEETQNFVINHDSSIKVIAASEKLVI
ncbi:MAG: MBL fold metallo-hydrolase [Melioribacteraceae bacterium]|nr:MBL fold metallo-hydrolase [Melioribacteraceae bacterium]MCF8264938.1 MBL fold metallo-hydrolase [Melioribacteraceae bacterium]MCF8413644.1 MBL fold metallo-hydrolase [Melioribacteraceae bacterium]